MSGTHPSEETLQQYVLDPTACRQEELDHFGSCPHCQALIRIYALLTIELDHQPAPAFDFDLAAVVIEQVQATGVHPRPVTPPVQQQQATPPVQQLRPTPPVQQQQATPPVPHRSGGSLAMWMMVVLAIGVPAWLFRRSAYFVFTDMSPDFYWLSLAATGLVIAFFTLRLQKKYQDVINHLNK